MVKYPDLGETETQYKIMSHILSTIGAHIVLLKLKTKSTINA